MVMEFGRGEAASARKHKVCACPQVDACADPPMVQAVAAKREGTACISALTGEVSTSERSWLAGAGATAAHIMANLSSSVRSWVRASRDA